MRRGRPTAALRLTGAEHTTLSRWARDEDARLALRARIILSCAESTTNKEVAELLGIWPQTVSKWRARFVRHRLTGLEDEPRSGPVRKLRAEQIDAIISKTLEEAPANGETHWSTRSMAQAVGLNQTAISRIWRTSGLRPHETDTWRLFCGHRPGGGACGIVGVYLGSRHRVLALVLEPVGGRLRAPCRLAVGLRPHSASRLTVPVSTSPGAGPSRPGSVSPQSVDVASGLSSFLDNLAGCRAEGLELHLAFAGDGAGQPSVRSWLVRNPGATVHPVPALDSWHRLMDRWVNGLGPQAGARLHAGMAEWARPPGADPFRWARPARTAGRRRPVPQSSS
jgi:transposase